MPGRTQQARRPTAARGGVASEMAGLRATGAASDPALARDVVNTLIRSFITWQMDKKVGAAGHLGFVVAQQLAAWAEVTGTTLADLDVRDHRAIDVLVSRLRPDAVVNLDVLQQHFEAGALVRPDPDEKPIAGGPPQAPRRRATRAGLRIAQSAYPPACSLSALAWLR